MKQNKSFTKTCGLGHGFRLYKLAVFTCLVLSVFILLSCTAKGTDISFPDQDIRMTFVHTTDSHSKVLPFKYIPSMTDENLGILPCPGNDQLLTCQRYLGYDLADLPEGQIPDPRQTNECMQFNEAEEVCPSCFSGSFNKEQCYYCISDVRVSKRCLNYTYGGSARVSWAINRERENSFRFAHVDTGDYFQGAPIFNLFTGETEIRSLSAMGCDASVIGNHEFDQGASNLSNLLYKYATYQVLNANFMWEADNEPGSNKLGDLVTPYFIKNYDGIKIGYIGMGNLRSINSLGDADNSMGIRALDTIQVLETYVPIVRPQVDIVVILSHLGVDGDVRAAKKIPGIDIIFGGHDHVILDPPLEIINPEGKKTLVVHSGVNYKAITRLDVSIRNGEILTSQFKIIPISSQFDNTENEIKEDPLVENILYDYEFELDRAQALDREIGYSQTDFPRYAPGDSPLGNLVADAMRKRERIETDFALTNSLGIRADLDKGTVTVGKMYETFPFENSITTMYLSGPEIHSLFNYAAARSAAYGCKTQIQISGAKTVLDCTRGQVKELSINGIDVVKDYKLVAPYLIFSMATNDYIAEGGSGFDILEQNTTKTDTSISLRDVVIDYIESSNCMYSPTEPGDCGTSVPCLEKNEEANTCVICKEKNENDECIETGTVSISDISCTCPQPDRITLIQ